MKKERIFKSLMAASLLCALAAAAPADAGRPGVQTSAGGPTFIRLSDEQKPDGFEMRERDGRVVGMTVVKKDGSRMPLKQQSRPTCATSCPAGQTLTCWEDEEQLMSVCVCGPRGSSHFRLVLNGAY